MGYALLLPLQEPERLVCITGQHSALTARHLRSWHRTQLIDILLADVAFTVVQEVGAICLIIVGYFSVECDRWL